MQKTNVTDMIAASWSSPKGTFGCSKFEISPALGCDPLSGDVRRRHPFYVEIVTIPPGKRNYPYHCHGAQWEFYHILSGKGRVRHEDGTTELLPGDAFIFAPGEPHQILNEGNEELQFYLVSDNPIWESCYYPDSGKWSVDFPDHRLVRSEPLPYLDGEE